MPKSVFLIVSFIFLASVAAAEKPAGKFTPTVYSQPLDLQRSKVQVSLVAPFATLSGRLNRYSGKLLLDSGDFTKSQVALRVDLSDVTLDQAEAFGFSEMGALFKAIPSPIADFISDRILLIGKNRYKVHGVWSRNGKQHNAEVIVDLLQSSQSKTVLKIDVAGSVNKGSDEALKVIPGIERAEMESTLVFSEGRKS